MLASWIQIPLCIDETRRVTSLSYCLDITIRITDMT